MYKIENNCENCKHKDICKWESDAKHISDELSNKLSKTESPLKATISCVHYEYNPKPNSAWRSAFDRDNILKEILK